MFGFTVRLEETIPIQPESSSGNETTNYGEVEQNIQENEEKIMLLQKTNDELSSEMEQLKKQLTENHSLMLEKSQNEDMCKGNVIIIADLQSQLNHLNEDNQNLAAEIEKLRNANETDRQNITQDFESEKSKWLNDIDQLNETVNQNQVRLNDSSNQNVELTSKLEECTVQLEEKNAEINELNGALEQLQKKRSQENEELLSEMREINEALKNRGDVISKQKQSMGELNEKIDQLQQQIAQSTIVNDGANKQIEQLNDRVKEMESKSFVDGKFNH